ncbi:MAG: NAD(P)/FAD-dependent oxidoreductase [Actinomycetota bacterium]
MTAAGWPEGPVVVAGAGPAGCLLAIYLARQGHEVRVIERRSDLRTTDVGAGRSINLALATRGIVPLVDVGLIDRVNDITIPLRGRMVHTDDGAEPALQPYGSRPHEVIHSVSRQDLNAILLDAAEATGRVTIEFDRPLASVDFARSELRFDDGPPEPFGVVFGADGAGSPVRQSMAEAGGGSFTTEWLDHGYKELTLPPAADGGHQLDPNALHIWPRGEFMLIALANPAGDFTVTLFAPHVTFESLVTEADIAAFFEQHFDAFTRLVPDLVAQFFANPTGPLGTLRTTSWHLGAQAVIVGDAAHAIVPFHGQGMNAALESVRRLDEELRRSPHDLAGAFARYDTARRPSAEAIAAMALDNYVEMRAGVVDPDYLAKRALALELEQRHPDRISPRYNMVMFSTMPYAEAQRRAVAQAEILAAAVADPGLDLDALVDGLPLLPAMDPLALPDALSVR